MPDLKSVGKPCPLGFRAVGFDGELHDGIDDPCMAIDGTYGVGAVRLCCRCLGHPAGLLPHLLRVLTPAQLYTVKQELAELR